MIIHIDMDAFYASVEERENPALIGKPLIVGGRADSRGVVAAANYASRKFGIRSAMPTAQAVQRCPELIILPPRGAFYAEESARIRRIFERYTPVIEPLSLDEAFLDTSGSEKLHGSPIDIGHKIKADIKRELDLVASVGIGPNKFIAKLASDHDKPDGFTVVESGNVQAFLDPMPIERLWGIGKSAALKLHHIGVNEVRDIRALDADTLIDLFGKNGLRFHQLAQGLDNRQVTPDSEVKSISHETTFARDVSSMGSLESTLMTLVESVGFRLREAELRGRTIQLKLRYANFHTITRASSLPVAADATRIIWEIALQLLRQALSKKSFEVRLIGISVSNFSEKNSQVEPDQSDLFDSISEQRTDYPTDIVDQLADDIRHRFGQTLISRGKGIKINRK